MLQSVLGTVVEVQDAEPYVSYLYHVAITPPALRYLDKHLPSLRWPWGLGPTAAADQSGSSHYRGAEQQRVVFSRCS